MTVEQLKAKAYDILCEIERLQVMLRQVNQAIMEQSKKDKEKEPLKK